MVRPDVVAALISAIGEIACEDFGDMLDQASGAEIHAATVALRDAALSGCKPVPPLLSMDYQQLRRLAVQGVALVQLLDELSPTWLPWQERSLADVLKCEPAERVERLRRNLAQVGLVLDDQR
jgi:hypothetical protein